MVVFQSRGQKSEIEKISSGIDGNLSENAGSENAGSPIVGSLQRDATFHLTAEC